MVRVMVRVLELEFGLGLELSFIMPIKVHVVSFSHADCLEGADLSLDLF